ncbi:hypothetical protein GCM10011318_07890 [Phaeocystidibacter marisrubri]|nr:hypothetical protein GCM10011318_07890 [Phaeocystidibacter marisrubri]
MISAVYKYREYLIERRLELSDTEASYCHKRLATLGNPVKKGFWYHLRKDIREEIKASLKVEETSF